MSVALRTCELQQPEFSSTPMRSLLAAGEALVVDEEEMSVCGRRRASELALLGGGRVSAKSGEHSSKQEHQH